MKYTFCNSGTYFEFNPMGKIFPQPNKPEIKNIEFYQELVNKAKSPDVYLLDNSGRVYPPSYKEWEVPLNSNKIGRTTPFIKL